jgi:hypothetical protein
MQTHDSGNFTRTESWNFIPSAACRVAGENGSRMQKKERANIWQKAEVPWHKCRVQIEIQCWKIVCVCGMVVMMNFFSFFWIEIKLLAAVTLGYTP